MALVFHTFLRPAMQLVELRQTRPLYLLLIENIILSFLSVSIALVLFISSSSQFVVVSQQLMLLLLLAFYVKEAIFRLIYLMGLKRLMKPTHAYSILLMQVYGVRIFYTVQVTLASIPIPTQLVNAFLIVFSSLSTSMRSLTSRIFPSLYVYMLTSQISYLQILARIHFQSSSIKFQKLKSKVSTCHPMARQKSLPVPIGMTPKWDLAKSTSCLTNSFITQLMVPSPPQTITFVCTLSWSAAFLR